MSVYPADFGPLVISDDVNASIISTLRLWLPTHLHQIERERADVAEFELARPKAESFATVRNEEDWKEHRLPMVIVETTGTNKVEAVSGFGEYVADWNVQIMAIVRGRTYPETQRYTSLFEGAVRRVMLMQAQLMPGMCKWTGTEAIRQVSGSHDSGRYMCAAVSNYIVSVDSVAQSGAGPVVPDPYYPPIPADPDVVYGPYTDVTKVVVTADLHSPPYTIGG